MTETISETGPLTAGACAKRMHTRTVGGMADKRGEGKSPTYLLVAEKVGQDTIAWLRQERERLDSNGRQRSWRAISLELWAEHDLDVTEVTLRKWWADAQPEPATATG